MGFNMKVYKELMWFFKKEKKAYLTGISMLVIVAFLQLIPPRIVGLVVDEITTDSLTYKSLTLLILLLIANAIALYGLRYLWRISIFGSAVRLARLMRRNLFEHFTNMPISFYQRKRTGDLMAHATNDVQAIQQTAGFGILSLFDSLAQGGAVIIAMLFINWKLTLVALIPMPFMAILTNLYSNKLYKSFYKAQEAFSDMNDKTQESINGIKVTKSFGQEKEEIESFVEQSEDLLQMNMVVAKIDGLYDPTISFISGLCFILTLGFGGYLV
ncbi:MAG: multidrug transporter permease/ATP-binding protein, partial [Bacillales bacterium]|nr:multidrug transporter permease/ATP-binding protein [Bacillales bacterium]